MLKIFQDNYPLLSYGVPREPDKGDLVVESAYGLPGPNIFLIMFPENEPILIKREPVLPIDCCDDDEDNPQREDKA